ncbi:hypothetical protein EDD15DRAFT_1512307 [Pisolithus albus]|nr:hypothetical protein EDD15DRAFT_1512307 [Pisolithus albus]
MPPVPTKHKSRGKDVEEFGPESSYAREIEQKRNSGQISCAECRRLKIKCDKQIPCQSCQRRGCAALCPNGVLVCGSMSFDAYDFARRKPLDGPGDSVRPYGD